MRVTSKTECDPLRYIAIGGFLPTWPPPCLTGVGHDEVSRSPAHAFLPPWRRRLFNIFLDQRLHKPL